MNPVSFIEAKRDGMENTPQEIREFVDLANRGLIPDYQISAWLMATFFRGMTGSEIRVFTESLAGSGKTVRFPGNFQAVDKHSTGGVGDKTTLVVLPIAAACGVPVAKLSGRGLGFTGGTIDKLDSIPGFRSSLDMNSFMKQVEETGCAVSGHSPDLAPAEARFYELRDVTATIPCIPLITSSIVSKKIAGGASAFVFDVKSGSGAFMQDTASARELARQLVSLSLSMGRPSMAFITDMSQPLGKWIGNSAEVMEAIDVLRGEGPPDTRYLSIRLAAAMIFLGGRSCSLPEGESMARRELDSGLAFDRFRSLIRSQGGNDEEFVNVDKRKRHLAPSVHEVIAVEHGWVTSCDARLIGETIRFLGGGRLKKEQRIDPSICCELLAKRGDKVVKGSILARLYIQNEDSRLENAMTLLNRAFEIGQEPKPQDLVISVEGPGSP